MMEMAPGYLTDWLVRDPDLKSLHGHPEWVRLFGESPAES